MAQDPKQKFPNFRIVNHDITKDLFHWRFDVIDNNSNIQCSDCAFVWVVNKCNIKLLCYLMNVIAKVCWYIHISCFVNTTFTLS